MTDSSSNRSIFEAIFNAALLQDDKPINPNKPAGPDKQGGKKIFPTAPLRDLSILSTSVILARFQAFVKQAGKKTFVADVNRYRVRQYSANWLINATWREGDGPIRTRLERLEYLCFGSPTLRYLLYTIRREVLPSRDDPLAKKRKLLVTEATPLCAWFLEICLRYALIDVKVMHAELDQRERTATGAEFNRLESPLQVLIIMYDVSAQGLNLHTACHVAFVATAARNSALEIQGWGRILRVSVSEVFQSYID